MHWIDLVVQLAWCDEQIARHVASEPQAQAREVIRAWVQDYNEVRPHSSIGRMPPRRFARLHRQQAGDAGSAQNQPANKVTLQPRTFSE